MLNTIKKQLICTLTVLKMKVFVDKKESILTWIIILSFSIGVAGLLGPGLSKTERIIGLMSILIFAGVSIMREELYNNKKIGE